MENELRLIDAGNWDSFYADMRDSRNTMDSYDRGYMDALDRVDDWMDAQPALDAIPVVHARWEDVKETVMYVPDMKATFTHTAETCSACKARVGFVGPKIYLYDKCCPECGAIMDLGKNGP